MSLGFIYTLQFGFLFLDDEIVSLQMLLVCNSLGLPTFHKKNIRCQSLHFHHIIVIEFLALACVVVHPAEYDVCVVIRFEPFFTYLETFLVLCIRLSVQPMPFIFV